MAVMIPTGAMIPTMTRSTTPHLSGRLTHWIDTPMALRKWKPQTGFVQTPSPQICTSWPKPRSSQKNPDSHASIPCPDLSNQEETNDYTLPQGYGCTHYPGRPMDPILWNAAGLWMVCLLLLDYPQMDNRQRQDHWSSPLMCSLTPLPEDPMNMKRFPTWSSSALPSKEKYRPRRAASISCLHWSSLHLADPLFHRWSSAAPE